jgi:hypothetical protein
LFCNFYWLVPYGNAAGLIPDLSAPRPRLWLVRDANAVFITHCLRALPCLTLKIYSRDPRILRLLSYKQPDPRTRNDRSKEKPVFEARKRSLFSRILSRLFD